MSSDTGAFGHELLPQVITNQSSPLSAHTTAGFGSSPSNSTLDASGGRSRSFSE